MNRQPGLAQWARRHARISSYLMISRQCSCSSRASQRIGNSTFGALETDIRRGAHILLTDIIVLTDGQTWRLDQTLDFIQSTRTATQGAVRLFSLGIGDAVSHALVNSIAKAGGGYAEVVPSTNQGGWEDRVVSMTKAALTSDHLGPINVELGCHDNEGSQTGK